MPSFMLSGTWTLKRQRPRLSAVLESSLSSLSSGHLMDKFADGVLDGLHLNGERVAPSEPCRAVDLDRDRDVSRDARIGSGGACARVVEAGLVEPGARGARRRLTPWSVVCGLAAVGRVPVALACCGRGARRLGAHRPEPDQDRIALRYAFSSSSEIGTVATHRRWPPEMM